MTQRNPRLDEVVSDAKLDAFARWSPPELIEPPSRRVPFGVSLLVAGFASGALVGLSAARVLPVWVGNVALVVCAAVTVTVVVLECRSESSSERDGAGVS